MQSDNELRNGAGRGLDRYTALALIVSLVLYPLLYSLDFFNTVFPSWLKASGNLGTLVKSTDKAGGFCGYQTLFTIGCLFYLFGSRFLKTAKIGVPLV